MSQFIRSQSLIQKGLAVAVTAVMMSSVYAATEKEEIQSLRQEVAELKALLTQQAQVQQQQQVQLAEVKAQPATASAPLSLKSKAGASVNLYGFVRADAEYSAKGADGIFNAPNKVDLNGVAVGEKDPKTINPNKDRFYATAKTTRLGLDFVAPVQGADVGGKIEVDFAGTNEALRIRHAYLTYNQWLFGQTTSSFLSGETTAEMLDFGSPLGIGTKRIPMVRYADKWGADTFYFVGLEKGADANRLPTLTGKVSTKIADGKGLVTARALLQEDRGRIARNGQEYKDETELSWGVAAGLNFKPIEQLTLNADYSHVSGDNNSLIGFVDNSVVTNTNDIDLVDFDAVTVGATYKFNPKVRSTLGYGAIFYDDKYLVTGKNETLQQGWLNVMYNPIKPITFGAEYIYGERETVGGQVGRDSSVGLMAKYDF